MFATNTEQKMLLDRGRLKTLSAEEELLIKLTLEINVKGKDMLPLFVKKAYRIETNT